MIPILIVIPSFRYDIQSTVEAIIDQRCTHLLAVSSMLIDLIKYVEENEIRITSLRGILTTALAVPREVAQKVRKVIPGIETVHIVYGASETLSITMPLRRDSVKNTLDNVGMPLDFAEVKIVDMHTGDIVKIGQTGEWCSPYTVNLNDSS